MSLVGSRYAEALLSLLSSPEEADKIGSILDDFSHTLKSEKDVSNFMLNPIISRAIKKETIGKLIDPDAPGILTGFLSLLVDKDRLSELPGICKEYEKLKAQRRNILHMTVYSAQPLEDEQLSAIGEKYMKVYGALSVKIETVIDASLLGGVCVQIGDIRIDDTLLGRLKGLGTTLAAAN